VLGVEVIEVLYSCVPKFGHFLRERREPHPAWCDPSLPPQVGCSARRVLHTRRHAHHHRGPLPKKSG